MRKGRAPKMRTTVEYGFPFLVVGVGLGLLAGILWDSRTGKELREEFRDGSVEGLNFLNDEGEKIRVGADRWFAKIRKYFQP